MVSIMAVTTCRPAPDPAFSKLRSLGDHLKTGHTLSVQNRPTGLAEDVIVYLAAVSVCKARFVPSELGLILKASGCVVWWESLRRGRALPQSSTGRFEVISVLARS